MRQYSRAGGIHLCLEAELHVQRSCCIEAGEWQYQFDRQTATRAFTLVYYRYYTSCTVHQVQLDKLNFSLSV